MTPERIELREGEAGYASNGQIFISPSEIGIDLVLLRVGQDDSSASEVTVTVGQSVKVNAGERFEVSLLGIGEGNLEENIPPSAKISVTRL